MSSFEMFLIDTATRSYAAGEVIFAKGQPGDAMYVVKEGEVEIRVGEYVIDTHGPGNIFGEMALIEDAPRSADAIAKTDCTLVPINEHRFLFLVQQTPFFAIRVMQVISGRLRRRMASQ